MVYRLSAADAYRKYLVKKIEVKGIAETKTMASDRWQNCFILSFVCLPSTDCGSSIIMIGFVPAIKSIGFLP